MSHAITLRNNREVGHCGQVPYLVAELGVSPSSADEAHDLIEDAAEAGFDAIKLQWHRKDEAEWDLIPPAAKAAILAQIEWQDMAALLELVQHAHDLGLAAGCTAFDPLGFTDLATRPTPLDFVKLGSAEAGLAHHLGAAADLARKLEVPLVLSSGCHGARGLLGAAEKLRPLPLVLLWCQSAYPSMTAPREEDLFALRALGDVVGVSDHWDSVGSGDAAVRAGAAWIEKHITPGQRAPDAEVALKTQIGRKEWVEAALRAAPEGRHAGWWALPGWWYGADMVEGALLANGCASRRPCAGMASCYTPYGYRLNRDVKAGDPVRWEDLRRA